ncbi:alpha/beta hydrolase [Pseudomonas canadensis]|uniref:alpha/beta hydrolase n=1 Tax=Pseudomonas canadensis TaxID=915099 RepID=UPI002892B286|nr:alpha/beta hydrolase [Pseudomonas canadensis]WNJ82660.1 alpha/beta hydrolase [Pseudomonas canadensis]
MKMPDVFDARSMQALLVALDAAVKSGDRTKALELEREILQRSALLASNSTAVEQQVRALRIELDSRQDIPDELSLDDLSLERSANTQGFVYPVWFGTNRRPQGKGFTGQRHNLVTYGRALVHVPKAHRFGEIGSSFFKRLMRLDLRNDRLRLQTVDSLTPDSFFQQIRAQMAEARVDGDEVHALVFLHGYNVTFEEAAIRAAQLGVDLNVSGATAFFSWPSRGSVSGYLADEASIEASEAAITDFLLKFSARCGADKLHIIAHSMGNRGFLRALQRVTANAETRGKVKFGQIFLAAPDVDRDLFLDLSYLYTEHAERVTLYASDADKAVHLSAKIHDSPRAGYFAPYTVTDSVDTVTVPDFDVDLLGHGYFSQAEALLSDIHGLIRKDTPPSRRLRMIAEASDGRPFWRLRL